MAAATHFQTVQKIYIAFYQRPADPAGLKYWADRIDVAGGDASAVVAAFANSPEAVALYGTIDATTIGSVVDKIYMALFNKAPDAAGKQFYVDGFNAGTFTPGTIALNILNGATGDDAVAINNKAQVANSFTQQVDGRALNDVSFGTGSSFNATYQGDADATAARDILKNVTSSPATVLNQSQVTEEIKTKIADAGDLILGQSGGQTFTLTEGVDNIAGTGGNDTIIAGEGSIGGKHTLGTADVINGGAGVDTLELTLAGQTVVPRMTGVEKIFAQALTGANGVNMVNATGVQELWSDSSTAALSVTNLQEKAAIGVKGGNGSTNAATDYIVQAAVPALAGDLAIVLNAADVDLLRVNSTGVAGALGYGSTTINATTGNNAISGKAGFETSSVDTLDVGSKLATVTVIGDGAVRVTNNLATSVTKIDASANKGGVNFSLAVGKDVTFTGGEGNDRINFNGGLTLADKVDGGAGRDVLAVSDQTSVTPGLQVTNMEVLELNTLSGTLTASLLGVDEVRVTTTLSNTQGTAIVNGLTSNSTFVTNDAGDVQLNIKNAQVAGTADTLNLQSKLAADGTVRVMAGGVETIAYTDNSKAADGRVTAVNFYDTDGVVDVSSLSIKGSAGNTVTFNGLANTIDTVDASASMGKVNVSISAGNATNGVSITGGAGDAILVGGDGKDIIKGGAGDDRLQGDAAAGIQQLTALTTFGTVDIGDTYSFTVNGQAVTYTAVAATQADVVNGLAAAINANPFFTGSGISAVNAGGNLGIVGAANGTPFTVANVASMNAAAAAQVTKFDFGAVGYDAGDSIASTIAGQVVTTGALAAATSAVGAAAAFANAVNANGVLAGSGITAVITGSEVSITGPASGAMFATTTANVTNALATADVETLTFAGSVVGDVYNVTVQGVALNTLISDGAVANDATTIMNLVNANATLLAAGVTAGAAGAVATITDAQGQNLALSVVKAGTGTATTGSTTTGIVVTNNGNMADVTTAGHGVGGAAQTLPTLVEFQAPVLGGTAASDSLEGGAGKDTYVFVGQSSVAGGTMDTIVELDLGGASSAVGVDTIQLSSAVLGYGAFGATALINAGGTVAMNGPTLTAALQGLYNAGGTLDGATNNVGLFTYGADTYLIAADNVAGLGANDIVIKVTGVTGTLDLSDLTIV